MVVGNSVGTVSPLAITDISRSCWRGHGSKAGGNHRGDSHSGQIDLNAPGSPEAPLHISLRPSPLRHYVFAVSPDPILSLDLPGITKVKSGKVREVFDLGDSLLFVATDRISAFDCVMPNGIPRKGEVLTQVSHFWFDQTENWQPSRSPRGQSSRPRAWLAGVLQTRPRASAYRTAASISLVGCLGLFVPAIGPRV